MAKDSLQKVIALIKGQLVQGNIPELPDGGTREVMNGQLPLAEEGLFIVSFEESYQHATQPPDHATDSAAVVEMAVQAGKPHLDNVNGGAFADLPLQALAYISGAVRTYIESKSGDRTWSNSDPGIELRYTRSILVFAEGLDLGVIMITLNAGGFDE